MIAFSTRGGTAAMRDRVFPRRCLVLCSLLLGGLLHSPAAAGEASDELPARIAGKVVELIDGDTIVVWTGKKNVKVRLAGIDAPERKQEFGSKAQLALAKKINRKQVSVVTHGTDIYDRVLGTVLLAAARPPRGAESSRAGDEDVNLWLVEQGWAWHAVEYSDSASLAKAEASARQAKVGLWAGSNPIAPWDWRTADAAKREEEAAEARAEQKARAAAAAAKETAGDPAAPVAKSAEREFKEIAAEARAERKARSDAATAARLAGEDVPSPTGEAKAASAKAPAGGLGRERSPTGGAGDAGFSTAVLICGLLLICLVYFLPTEIAMSRGHPNLAPILVTNFFFGLTCYGWVVALAWSLTAFPPRR